MKKLLCAMLILTMLTAACAETLYDCVRIRFEDGFALSVPADWVSYEVSDADAANGYLYCLGSADGSRLMYIQRWAAGYTCIEDLQAELENRDDIVLRSASVTGNNIEFLMYNFGESDASGCMTLYGDSVVNLLFLPQSDPENMLIAAATMESFEG